MHKYNRRVGHERLLDILSVLVNFVHQNCDNLNLVYDLIIIN